MASADTRCNKSIIVGESYGRIRFANDNSSSLACMSVRIACGNWPIPVSLPNTGMMTAVVIPAVEAILARQLFERCLDMSGIQTGDEKTACESRNGSTGTFLESFANLDRAVRVSGMLLSGINVWASEKV